MGWKAAGTYWMSIQTAWKPETAKAKEIQRGTVKGVSEDMFTRRGKDTGTTLDSDRNVIMSGREAGFSPPLLPRGERPRRETGVQGTVVPCRGWAEPKGKTWQEPDWTVSASPSSLKQRIFYTTVVFRGFFSS